MIKLDQSRGENFCIAPWVNLHIQTTGSIKPCCGGNDGSDDGNFGYAQDGDWSYINGTSQRLTEFKHDLLNNKKVSYCDGCQEKEWYSEFLHQGVSVDHVDDFLFRSIDLRWGTTCQLSCLYCGPETSSTWQSLESKQKVIPIEKSRSYDGMFDQLFSFLQKNHSNIDRISLLGGEPLLLKENHRLLDVLPDSAHIEIFTNLNVNLDSNVLYQKLVNRDHVKWYISMENIQDRFEFVRRGANWAIQFNNIQKLRRDIKDASGQRMTLQSQFCVYSALNLRELYDCFAPLNIDINWGLLHWPEVLDFRKYPRRLKERCLSDIDSVMTDPSVHTTWSFENVKANLTKSLDTEKHNIIGDCREWHQTQKEKYFADQSWDFDDLWPVYRDFQQNSPWDR